jgi:hypothetical protein
MIRERPVMATGPGVSISVGARVCWGDPRSLPAQWIRKRQANGVAAGTNQCFGVIEAGGLDPDQSLAHFQRSQFLVANLNDVRTAGTERASDTPQSTWAHGLTPYHPTSSDAQCEVHRVYVQSCLLGRRVNCDDHSRLTPKGLIIRSQLLVVGQVI